MRASEKTLPRILVVDDDQTLRAFYSDVLSQENYHLDFAENGAIGLKSAEAQVYDVIITDHQMPSLSGLDLIERLAEKGHRTPIILISGSLSPDEPRLVNLRLFAFVPKPISAAFLVSKVAEALASRPRP